MLYLFTLRWSLVGTAFTFANTEQYTFAGEEANLYFTYTNYKLLQISFPLFCVLSIQELNEIHEPKWNSYYKSWCLQPTANLRVHESIQRYVRWNTWTDMAWLLSRALASAQSHSFSSNWMWAVALPPRTMLLLSTEAGQPQHLSDSWILTVSGYSSRSRMFRSPATGCCYRTRTCNRCTDQSSPQSRSVLYTTDRERSKQNENGGK
jgi:hypothetical protein